MKQVVGNLLDVETGTIVHQVNMYKTMGHGIARQIAGKWPSVFSAYKNCNASLGACQMIAATPRLYVANLYGQVGIGTDNRKTHYGYLAHALAMLEDLVTTYHANPVYFPYKMSSDLAGGDWIVVLELIEAFFPDATIVELPAYDRMKGIPA
jgi:O-acetyl-ADP-ribose deacetylase (regulator of RNase III)